MSHISYPHTCLFYIKDPISFEGLSMISDEQEIINSKDKAFLCFTYHLLCRTFKYFFSQKKFDHLFVRWEKGVFFKI